MRRYIELLTEDEDEETALPSVAIVKQLASEICVKAQEVYDSWQQDEEGQDEELGAGGICHIIAEEAIASVLSSAGVNVSTVSDTYEVHVYCVAAFSEGVYSIDIHHSWYERGGGYTWTKVPGVRFEPRMIDLYMIDSNPAHFERYIES